ILTVVDIRAVGPGTWNGWKAQLLRTLFDAAEEMLRLGHKRQGRSVRVDESRRALGARLGWDEASLAAYAGRLADSYWLAEPIEVIERNARFVAAADAAGPDAPGFETTAQPERAATLVTV